MWNKIENYIDNTAYKISKKTSHWSEAQNFIGLILFCAPIVIAAFFFCLFLIVLVLKGIYLIISTNNWWMLFIPSAWLYYHLWSIGCFSSEEHDEKDNNDENSI